MRGKTFFISAIAALSFHLAKADEVPKVPIKIEKPIYGGTSETSDLTRAPTRVPCFYIEECTLTIDEFYLGFTLQLVENEQVVYTYEILTTDDLELPETLAGEYELQLIGYGYTFVGIIEL